MLYKINSLPAPFHLKLLDHKSKYFLRVNLLKCWQLFQKCQRDILVTPQNKISRLKPFPRINNLSNIIPLLLETSQKAVFSSIKVLFGWRKNGANLIAQVFLSTPSLTFSPFIGDPLIFKNKLYPQIQGQKESLREINRV